MEGRKKKNYDSHRGIQRGMRRVEGGEEMEEKG